MPQARSAASGRLDRSITSHMWLVTTLRPAGQDAAEERRSLHDPGGPARQRRPDPGHDSVQRRHRIQPPLSLDGRWTTLDETGTRRPTSAGERGRRRPEPLPPGTCRWTAPRKAQVVDAVEAGRLTPEPACRAYRLSPEELAAWKRALDRYGVEGLKLARRQGFRSAGTAAAAGAHRWRGQEP